MTVKTWGVVQTTPRSQWISTSGGPYSIVQTRDRLSHVNFVRLNRSETPKYRERLKRGELLPFQYYEKFEQLLLMNEGEYSTQSNPPGGYSAYWEAGGGFPEHPVSSVELHNILSDYNAQDLVQAAAARIYSSGFDALTFASELKSVHRMFLGIGDTLLKVIKQAKGANANAWLQYRYGWRTLIMDLRELDEAIRNINGERKRFSEKANSTISYSDTSYLPWNYSTSTGTRILTEDVTIGLRGMVIADIEPPRFAFNPFVTGWELIRFSFIIDWFVNVGQWLAAMSFLTLQTKYFASMGYQISKSTLAAVQSYSAKSGHTVTACSQNWSYRAKLSIRVPTSISLRLSTSVRLDVKKIIDLLALIIQARR